VRELLARLPEDVAELQPAWLPRLVQPLQAAAAACSADPAGLEPQAVVLLDELSLAALDLQGCYVSAPAP